MKGGGRERSLTPPQRSRRNYGSAVYEPPVYTLPHPASSTASSAAFMKHISSTEYNNSNENPNGEKQCSIWNSFCGRRGPASVPSISGLSESELEIIPPEDLKYQTLDVLENKLQGLYAKPPIKVDLRRTRDKEERDTKMIPFVTRQICIANLIKGIQLRKLFLFDMERLKSKTIYSEWKNKAMRHFDFMCSGEGGPDRQKDCDIFKQRSQRDRQYINEYPEMKQAEAEEARKIKAKREADDQRAFLAMIKEREEQYEIFQQKEMRDLIARIDETIKQEDARRAAKNAAKIREAHIAADDLRRKAIEEERRQEKVNAILDSGMSKKEKEEALYRFLTERPPLFKDEIEGLRTKWGFQTMARAGISNPWTLKGGTRKKKRRLNRKSHRRH
jgi:hypothetical protein